MKTAFFDGILPRVSRYGLVFAVVAGLWLSLGGVAALAAGEAHPFLLSFGSFTNPNGIAVDESTGDVYVADIATNTVNRVTATGEPAEFAVLHSSVLTGAGTPAKAFSFPDVYGTPAAIAVDNSTDPADPSRGDLYVMDAGNGVIDKFDADGEYLSQITGFKLADGSGQDELLGLAISTNGTVRAELSASSVAVDEFDDTSANHLIAEQVNQAASRTFSGVPAQPRAAGFAVGPTGDDYMLYGGSCSCIAKLGQQLAGLGEVDGHEAGDVAVAADPATGHVYVDDQASIAEWDAGTLNGGKFEAGEGTGVLVGEPFGAVHLSVASGQGGIAVNGATGDIYVSSPTDGKVYVFGSDAPAVTAGAPTNVTKTAATLNGTVNPRGGALGSCEFKYGVADEFGQGQYEHSAVCRPDDASIGAGTSPVPVSASIAGLEPGLLYRVVLIASNSSGSNESTDFVATLGVGFGIKAFSVSFLNEDGSPDTQAGSHPFELVNDIEYFSHYTRKESNADSPYAQEPNGALKNLTVDLPAGVVGDPNATARKCTLDQLASSAGGSDDGNCPPEAKVGQITFEWSKLLADESIGASAKPVNNMVPPRGTALQLGISYFETPVLINNAVGAGGDYPVQARVTSAPPEAPLLKSELRIHGVVGEGTTRKAFLTLPTGCHGPLRSTVMAESYGGEKDEKTGLTENSAGQPVSLTGCSKLLFPPTVSAEPDTTDASAASGLTVGVHVPQTAAFNPEGLAESTVRNTTVTLPEGVAINPAGADGLEACSGALAGFTGFSEFNPEFEPGVQWATFTPEMPNPSLPGVNFCPSGSKIATVKIKTPLLEHELEGDVYLASQNTNPFGSLVAMYIVVEDPFSGSLVKLAGEVHLTEAGQIVTTFKNTPDLPFENLEIHFFGGERAPLTTPSRCGTYTTTAVFTPWDGNGSVTSESSFKIEHGPNGGPCPGSNLPFEPSLTAGTTSNQAGGYSSFTMTMSREDGQQSLQAINLKMPPGLSGILTGVELCPEAQANAGMCGPGSLIGETTVSVGVGSDPFSVRGGRVYLTGPYKGAPFGLSIVNPAKAGPYDVEHDTSRPGEYVPACDCLVVRAKIEVNPTTAALTVTSDNEGPYKIPTVLDGIPLKIKHVNVTINRPGFTFNPTNCNPLSITGSLHSTEGASSAVSLPFQATDCAALGFAPKFSASTSSRTSRADGASLAVKLSYPNVGGHSILASGLANIAEVKVELPKALPSRLTTLQKACTKAQFEANPAGCPPASIIGHAKATTPLLPVQLEGPAYFVSNGGEAFPNLIVVLQGYGVTIDLVGDTFISKAGVTSSTFKTVPDAPVGSFELDLPAGPYSALTAAGNLCRAKSLVMPTEFLAQNGAELHQATKIAVTGCPKVKKAAKHTKRKAKHGKRKRGKPKHGQPESRRTR
jgi:hypothetical protein